MRLVRTSLALTFTAVFGLGLQLTGADATLLDAIRTNDGNRVHTLLTEGADANQASALMYAALYAGPRVLDQLIRAGADLTYRDKNGLTVLTWAVHSYESAKVLIDAGASVNAKSNIGGTPLLTAAAYPGNAALLQLMLERGADIQNSVFGSTPLTMAALTGDADSVALLFRPKCPRSSRAFRTPPGGPAGRSPDGAFAH